MPSRPKGCGSSVPTRPRRNSRPARFFARTCSATADIPTADYQVFRDPTEAIHYLNERDDCRIVVKADGLAAGKGVVVCSNRDEAIRAVEQIALQKVFGAAGDRLVIEERLDGQEASVLAITDGSTIVTLQPAQDHKAAYDGDAGPNTGGMGRLLPGPLGRRRKARLDRRARPRADRSRHESCPAAVSRRAVCRDDDDLPGPEGAGVQRPLRRSGVPAAVDAAEDRSARSARCRGGRHARLAAAAGVGPAAGGLRGDGRQGLSRPVRQRPSHSRIGRGREAGRREGLPCRHGRRRRGPRA